MKRYKPEPVYSTEADLCAAFIAWAHTFDGWTCYAETCEWDLLLAHRDGTQIGVQAKLALNLSVLSQAMETASMWMGNDATGPDFRAVLVPSDRGFKFLLDAIGITPITPQRDRYDIERGAAQAFSPSLAPDPSRWSYGAGRDPLWHYCNPTRRHTLPEFVPDVPAGVPSPSPLSDWKIAALRLCAIMELRGHLTRQDFKRVGVDWRRWRESWLDPLPARDGCWTWRKGFDGFAAQHPVVYPQVRAKVVQEKLADVGVPA